MDLRNKDSYTDSSSSQLLNMPLDFQLLICTSDQFLPWAVPTKLTETVVWGAFAIPHSLTLGNVK